MRLITVTLIVISTDKLITTQRKLQTKHLISFRYGTAYTSPMSRPCGRCQIGNLAMHLRRKPRVASICHWCENIGWFNRLVMRDAFKNAPGLWRSALPLQNLWRSLSTLARFYLKSNSKASYLKLSRVRSFRDYRPQHSNLRQWLIYLIPEFPH